MADVFQAPDPKVEVAPEDESAQPIVIRKLDRLETTCFSNPSGN
jgi:hypothetical protein